MAKMTALSIWVPVEYAAMLEKVASKRGMTAVELHRLLVARGVGLPVHKPRPVGRPRKGKE